MSTLSKHAKQYQFSIIFIGLVTLIGFMLQVELGSFDLYIFTSPVNVYAIVLLIFLSSAGFIFPRNRLVLWLSSLPFAITLLLFFLILGLIMGLTPQKTSAVFGSMLSTIGFTRMTSSWPFVFIYTLTLISLGLLIARRLRHFRPFTPSFHLNHIGLWILLVAAGLGHADQRRFVMYVELDQGPQWRVYNTNNKALELPIAIELKKFSMETYPAKIAIYSSKFDAAIPQANPIFFQLEAGASHINILDWDITVDTYYHEAAPSIDGSFRPWPVVGSAPAAKVTVRNVHTQEVHEGWVSSGSLKGLAQPYQVLQLDQENALVMLPPEPKHFVSDIVVYTPDNKPQRTNLTVNNPYTIGNWKLYQQGYDSAAGALSIYSAIELVYDSWINFVYIGFTLMALGAFGMIWNGRKEKQS